MWYTIRTDMMRSFGSYGTLYHMMEMFKVSSLLAVGDESSQCSTVHVCAPLCNN